MPTSEELRNQLQTSLEQLYPSTSPVAPLNIPTNTGLAFAHQAALATPQVDTSRPTFTSQADVARILAKQGGSGGGGSSAAQEVDRTQELVNFTRELRDQTFGGDVSFAQDQIVEEYETILRSGVTDAVNEAREALNIPTYEVEDRGTGSAVGAAALREILNSTATAGPLSTPKVELVDNEKSIWGRITDIPSDTLDDVKGIGSGFADFFTEGNPLEAANLLGKGVLHVVGGLNQVYSILGNTVEQAWNAGEGEGFDANRVFDAVEGDDNNFSFSGVLDRQGVELPGALDPIVGLTVDIFADPLNYVVPGAALRGGWKSAARAADAAGDTRMAANIARNRTLAVLDDDDWLKLGKYLDDAGVKGAAEPGLYLNLPGTGPIGRSFARTATFGKVRPRRPIQVKLLPHKYTAPIANTLGKTKAGIVARANAGTFTKWNGDSPNLRALMLSDNDDMVVRAFRSLDIKHAGRKVEGKFTSDAVDSWHRGVLPTMRKLGVTSEDATTILNLNADDAVRRLAVEARRYDEATVRTAHKTLRKFADEDLLGSANRMLPEEYGFVRRDEWAPWVSADEVNDFRVSAEAYSAGQKTPELDAALKGFEQRAGIVAGETFLDVELLPPSAYRKLYGETMPVRDQALQILKDHLDEVGGPSPMDGLKWFDTDLYRVMPLHIKTMGKSVRRRFIEANLIENGVAISQRTITKPHDLSRIVAKMDLADIDEARLIEATIDRAPRLHAEAAQIDELRNLGRTLFDDTVDVAPLEHKVNQFMRSFDEQSAHLADLRVQHADLTDQIKDAALAHRSKNPTARMLELSSKRSRLAREIAETHAAVARREMEDALTELTEFRRQIRYKATRVETLVKNGDANGLRSALGHANKRQAQRWVKAQRKRADLFDHMVEVSKDQIGETRWARTHTADGRNLVDMEREFQSFGEQLRTLAAKQRLHPDDTGTTLGDWIKGRTALRSDLAEQIDEIGVRLDRIQTAGYADDAAELSTENARKLSDARRLRRGAGRRVPTDVEGEIAFREAADHAYAVGRDLQKRRNELFKATASPGVATRLDELGWSEGAISRAIATGGASDQVFELDRAMRAANIQGSQYVSEADVIGKWVDGEINWSKLLKDSDTRETIAETVLDGWSRIGWDTMVPDEIFDGLVETSKLLGRGADGRLLDRKFSENFVRGVDYVTNLFKTQAVTSPGFHIRNVIGGVFNNLLAGVDVDSYLAYRKGQRAWGRAQKLQRNGMSFDDALRKVYPNQQERDIWRAINESGELTGGITGEIREIGQLGMENVGRARAALETVNPLHPNFFVYRKNLAVGGRAENFLRGSLMYDTMSKGGSLEDARDLVWKLHFDYDDLSTLEKSVGRRLVPFYTWSRKIMPVMIEGVLRHPAAFNKANQIKNNLEYGVAESPLYPSWFDSNFNIHIGSIDKGPLQGDDVFLMPDLPFNRLGETLSFDQLTSSLNPFLRAPIEMSLGQRFFDSAPLTSELLPVADGWVSMQIPQIAAQFGYAEQGPDGQWYMSGTAQYLLESWVPIFGRARRFFPSDHEDDERYQDRMVGALVSFLGGIGWRDVSERDVRSAYSERWRELQKITADLETKGELVEADDGVLRPPQTTEESLRAMGLSSWLGQTDRLDDNSIRELADDLGYSQNQLVAALNWLENVESDRAWEAYAREKAKAEDE